MRGITQHKKTKVIIIIKRVDQLEIHGIGKKINENGEKFQAQAHLETPHLAKKVEIIGTRSLIFTHLSEQVTLNNYPREISQELQRALSTLR